MVRSRYGENRWSRPWYGSFFLWSCIPIISVWCGLFLFCPWNQISKEFFPSQICALIFLLMTHISCSQYSGGCLYMLMLSYQHTWDLCVSIHPISASVSTVVSPLKLVRAIRRFLPLVLPPNDLLKPRKSLVQTLGENCPVWTLGQLLFHLVWWLWLDL